MSTQADRWIQLTYRILIPIMVTLGILLFPSCGREVAPGATEQSEPIAAASGEHVHVHHPSGVEDGLEPSGHSIFHLESEWWDQNGETRRLESLSGRVQVASMVYTHCAYACPRILADMKRIEAALGPERADEVGFVLVSIDPERDTPERLAEFARYLHLDADRWTILSAPEMSVLELAAVLGVRYVRESETDFGHTNLLAVLSPTGEIVHRQLGTGEGVEQTIHMIERLLGET